MKRPFPYFVLLSLCALTMSGCSKSGTGFSASEAKLAAQLPQPARVEDEPSKEITALHAQTKALFDARKFVELETLANNFQTTKARFGNGSWKIVQFYAGFECEDNQQESTWQQHAEINREWIAKFPQSMTAHVAYADFLTDYAWFARGGGYASSVTKTGWKLFKERIAEAADVLRESSMLKPRCPVWYRTSMTVALGQGWTRGQYEGFFAAAKKFEPEFWGYDIDRSWYLMPRWYGKSGDWEKAAETEADRPGSMGAEGYARVVIQREYDYKNVFKETEASWSLAREGCKTLHQKYPASLTILNDFCYLACRAGDRVLAKQLFKEINGRVGNSLYTNGEGDFMTDQVWAYSEN